LTIELAARTGKPCLAIDLSQGFKAATVHEWIGRNAIRTLNIAGPRESQCTGIYDQARTVVGILLEAREQPAESRD
jgi:hypothetical protein